MSEAREEILRRIRTAYGDQRPSVQPAPVPARATREPAAILETFVEMTADYRAVVERCGSDQVGDHIARVLTDAQARTVVIPDGLDPSWTASAPGEHVIDEHLSPAALDTIDAVVTSAAVGIADTGTIVLDHSAGQGRRALTLVPDLHICVVREDQVVADVPAGVAALRPAIEAGRALTWISGPSATSDIELNRVEGVHGPRNLHVLVVRA